MSGIGSVAIVGHGARAWPVAALLATELPESVTVCVFERADPGVPVAAVIPAGGDFARRLGFTPEQLMEQDWVISSLGSVLEGFKRAASATVVAPSGSLPMVGGVALHHLVRRTVQAKRTGEFGSAWNRFRFCARAAQAGKMALPSDAPQSPLAMLGPQVSFDCAHLAAFLRQRAGKRVSVSQGEPVWVDRDGDGPIQGIVLDDGERVTAELYIDCDGSLDAWATGAWAAKEAPLGELLDDKARMPRFRALDNAVVCEIPVRDGTLATPWPLARSELLERPWEANLVRLGRTSAPDLFSAHFALLSAQALHLADCFPASRRMQAEAQVFNRRQDETRAQIEAFALAPLYLSDRGGEAWDAFRSVAPPEQLRLRIEQFASRGRMPRFEREWADEQSWIDLLTIMGVEPRRHDRRADAIPIAQAARILEQIGSDLDRALATMPDASTFEARFG